MKMKKILWILLLVLVLAVFAVSAGMVIHQLLDRSASQRFQDELIDQMVTVVTEPQAAQPTQTLGAAVPSHVPEYIPANQMAAESPVSSSEPLQQASEPEREKSSPEIKDSVEANQTEESASIQTASQDESMHIPAETGEREASQQPDGDMTDLQKASPASTLAVDMPEAVTSNVTAESTTEGSQTMHPAAEILPPHSDAAPLLHEAEATISPAPMVTPEPTPMETAPIAVDFDKLTSKYKDVKAWVYLPETPINYAVAQGVDNYEYLRKRLDKGYSYSGSIFMDSMNAVDFSDWNTILYGHNMKNGSMFGYLPYYAVQEYYDRHPAMYLFAPGLAFKAEVFAGYVTTPDSDAYLIAQTMEERDDIIAEAKSKSTFEADVEIGPEDRIVTLSTCTYAYDNARYVLLAVLRPIQLATEKES